MITQTIINILKQDSQIQSLLGGPYVSVTNLFSDTVDKQINVSFDLGETNPITAGEDTANIYEGTVTVYILVKDSIQEPIKTINNIATRVLQLLDLKGTTLSDSYTTTVYWVRKAKTGDIKYYENIGFYELYIDFDWVAKI